MEKIHERDKRHAQTWLDQVKGIAEDRGVRSQNALLVPYPQTSTAGAIIDYAEDSHVDLIVIGTRGQSGQKNATWERCIGSPYTLPCVSDKVIVVASFIYYTGTKLS